MNLLCAGPADGADLFMRAEIKLASSDAGAKKAPRFEVLAYSGGPFRPEYPVLDAPLVIDLASAMGRDRIAAILDHDDRQIVGQTDRVKIGGSDIRMSGQITGDWQRQGEPAEKVMTHAAGGFVWPVSLGASIGGLERIDAGDSETINGNEISGPAYVARRVHLRHISFLSDPADQTAYAKIAARAAKKESVMDFHAWLLEMGFDDPAVLSETQRTALQAKFEAEKKLKAAAMSPKPAPTTPPARPPVRPPNDDPLAEAKAKRARTYGIKELMSRYADEYPEALEEIEARGGEAMEDESITVRDLETILLRNCTRSLRIDARPRKSGQDQAVDNKVIEAALCRAGGLSPKTLGAKYSDQTLEMSEQRFRHGLGLRDFLELAARANGVNASFKSQMIDVLAAALPDRRMMKMAGGPSTYDVSDILGNVLNRFIVDHFMAVDQTAMRAISFIRSVSDFRQIESYSLTGDMTYEKVAPGGELKHGTFGDVKYTNQAYTYGKILGIDRRDIINDDIGAFQNIGRRLGRGGALAMLNVFWTAFMDNAAFFTAGLGNYDSGADTALSLDALSNAKLLFNLQSDPDGKPMNVAPRILLVPPELEGTAKTILNSQLVVMTGTTDAVIGNANIHAGTLDLAMARELSNSSYTGYSTLAWYLLALPNDLPVIETCFLNGVDRPTVENAQADFDTLGIKMRGYFDFGVNKQEYRAGVKIKGEA